MRLPLAVSCVLMIAVSLIAARRAEQTCALDISLTDAQTGAPLAGQIKVTTASGEVVTVNELLSRGLGLKAGEPIQHWAVLTKSTTITLPAQALTIEAFSGLETETTRIEIDLRNKTKHTLSIPLHRFYNAADRGFRSANTHLHLMKLSRAEVDRYLTEIPRADGLDIVFLSYLERAGADHEYTSNTYTADDLARLSKASGTGFGNGEEHRHNYGGGGEGYGHVMFLNIKELIQPVSIGPGIMKLGTDGLPIQRGIDTARGDGATVVWCHNDWGLEDLANWATGRIDAQNIFDGGIHSSYKQSFYRYLNAGIDVPFSTGTDWFMYDFSRVYVAAGKYVTPAGWLAALSSGKTYITNGPLLEFTVNGQGPGSTIDIDNGKPLKIEARGWGRHDFKRLELIKNGNVVDSAPAERQNNHFVARLNITLETDQPCWLALRTPAPPLAGDAELTEPVNKNEFGKDLFAHSSAIHIVRNGRRYLDRKVAEGMIQEMTEIRAQIDKQSNFADPQERSRVLDVYSDGIDAMRKRLQN